MAVNHFKEFGTVAEYEAYIQPDDYAKPLVALVDETDTVMFPQGGGGGTGNPILKSDEVDDYSGGAAFNALSQITGVEFPSGITSIDNEAFYKCSSLTSVSIPSGVTSIGKAAFQNCSLLESVTIPSSVTALGESAFQYCYALTSVTIPEGVTSILKNAFYGCTLLTSVSIPSGVTSIGNGAFQNCSSLASVTIPEGVTSIGSKSFNACRALTSVTVRATTPPTLGTNAFQDTHANMVIYVPAESVADYQAASGWSTFASKIQAIP